MNLGRVISIAAQGFQNITDKGGQPYILLYYENNGLLDSFPEDRVESRTDWNTLNDLYSTLMYGISELKNN